MNRENNSQKSALRQALSADHHLLEASFDRVIASLRGADIEQIRERWLALDQAVERHLSAEDEVLLPLVGAVFPEVAERVRREHGEIRRALVQLGVDLDLHELCPASATRFIDALRRHAAFEEAELYPWVDAHLDEPSRLSLLARLRTHLHLGRRARAPHSGEQELS